MSDLKYSTDLKSENFHKSVVTRSLKWVCLQSGRLQLVTILCFRVAVTAGLRGALCDLLVLNLVVTSLKHSRSLRSCM